MAVRQVGAHAFAVGREWVDEVVQVSENDVSLAVLRLIEGQKMIVEGGGATGLAALLPGGDALATAAHDRRSRPPLTTACNGRVTDA